MLYFAIFAALWLILPILGVWPILTTGESYTNRIFTIEMHPREWTVSRGWDHDAIYAEEIGEWWFISLIALAIAAPLVWLVLTKLALLPVGQRYLIAIFVWLVCNLWHVPTPMYRQVEWVGHACNIVEGMKRDVAYLDKEVAKMQIGTDELFSDMTLMEIERGVKRRFPVARFLNFILTRNRRRA